MVQITETIKLFKTRQGAYGFYDESRNSEKWIDCEKLRQYSTCPNPDSVLNYEQVAKLENAICSLYEAKRSHGNDYGPALSLMDSIVHNPDIDTRKKLLDEYVPDDNYQCNTSIAKDEDGNVVDKNVQALPLDEVLDDCIKFFKEFDFLPNFRFVSMISDIAKKSLNKVKDYVNNYFELSDKMTSPELKEKMKSWEFENICNELAKHECKTQNHRLKIFYGPQGTGKTTLASKETKDIIVCHSGMLPADLMEDFEFDDGKAGFHKSLLWKAMENGTPVVLDEINLLQLDSLRFLQGLLDEKDTINYKGQEIHIKDGFYIIGTMNLEVNGCTYALPEPLVDRCSEIKKFDLTGKQLASMFN